MHELLYRLSGEEQVEQLVDAGPLQVEQVEWQSMQEFDCEKVRLGQLNRHDPL